MADPPTYRWQVCPVCHGMGCGKCEQNGAFVFDDLTRRWVSIPLAMVYPAAAELIVRLKALENRVHEIDKPPCPHIHIQTIEFGDAICHVVIRSCRKCGAQLPSAVVAP